MGGRRGISGAPASGQIFSVRAIEAVFGHSRGIPRLINTICDNALLSGYAKQAATITPEIVDGVARDLRLGVVAVEPRNEPRDEPRSGGTQLAKAEEQNELLPAGET